MRWFCPVLVAVLAGCSPTTPSIDGGGGGSGAGGGGEPAAPADAGVPLFTADTFCDVFARAACQWAATCGQRTAGEEAACVAVKKHGCPRAVSFDVTAANVCLLRLESARCGRSRVEGCPEAWPAAVPDGGACLSSRECLAGVCASDGGACGVCSAPGALGETCDAFHPCDAVGRCDVGGDGGVQCIAKLAAGEKCDAKDEVCLTGRCLFKVGKGLTCVSGQTGGSCVSNAGCATSQYCDVARGQCKVPEPLNAACESQDACAAFGNVCLRGTCSRVPPFTVAEGKPCTETAQCAWGLACDVRAAAPVCVRRVEFDAGCQLAGLDVWDPRCPYLAMCHPATQRCAEAAMLCSFPGYCPKGPGPNDACDAGAICRGQSTCGDLGDGGYRCLPVGQPAGSACFLQLASSACSDSTCVGGTCSAWPPARSCP